MSEIFQWLGQFRAFQRAPTVTQPGALPRFVRAQVLVAGQLLAEGIVTVANFRRAISAAAGSQVVSVVQPGPGEVYPLWVLEVTRAQSPEVLRILNLQPRTRVATEPTPPGPPFQLKYELPRLPYVAPAEQAEPPAPAPETRYQTTVSVGVFRYTTVVGQGALNLTYKFIADLLGSGWPSSSPQVMVRIEPLGTPGWRGMLPQPAADRVLQMLGVRSGVAGVGSPAFDWLGAPIALRGGQLYRGRVVVQPPVPVPCALLPVNTLIPALRNALVDLPTVYFPADLIFFTEESGLPADWPGGEFRSDGVEPGQCPIWFQARASSDAVIDDEQLGLALRAVPGVVKAKFWHEPGGGRTPGLPQPPCAPGQVFDADQQRCVDPEPAIPPGETPVCADPELRWDPELGDCVPIVQCAADQVPWFTDPVAGDAKCVPRDCPPNSVRNPNTGDCVPCPAGSSFDPTRGDCVPQQVPPPTCPTGYTFDPATRLCNPPATPGPTPPPASAPAAASTSRRRGSATPVLVALGLAGLFIAAVVSGGRAG